MVAGRLTGFVNTKHQDYNPQVKYCFSGMAGTVA
jgi:hypothetical protein